MPSTNKTTLTLAALSAVVGNGEVQISLYSQLRKIKDWQKFLTIIGNLKFLGNVSSVRVISSTASIRDS